MRRSIQRWHVGQLVMVWIAGLLFAAVGFTLSLFAHEAANSMRIEAERARETSITAEWRDARSVGEEILRNWKSSEDPAWTDSSIASLGFVEATDRSRVVENVFKLKAAAQFELLVPRYLEREREEALARLTKDRAPRGFAEVAARVAGYVLLAVALFAPCLLFWMTWVWFDGRKPDDRAPAV